MSELELLLKQHTDDVGQALGEFKGQISSLQEAVTALNTTSVEIQKKMNRPIIKTSDDRQEIKGLSFPEVERKELQEVLRGKTMTSNDDPSGGYLVPEVTREQIEALVLLQSPIRQVAKIVTLSSGNESIPVNRGGATGGWVGENEGRSETDAPSLAKATPPGGTVYALPSATEELVDDAVNNIELFIQENVVDELAEMESQAFLAGNGINKPRGFLNYNKVSTADATRAFGDIQYIASGSAAVIADADKLAKLVAMVFATKAGLRAAPGCAWLSSTDFLSNLSGLKDSQGAPIYLPSMRENVPGVLLGYPVIECEHMDAIGAGTYPLAFGNWQRGYVIGDRTPLNVLRDPFTTKGKIKWYFRRRVHGGLLNSDAIKVLKIATS